MKNKSLTIALVGSFMIIAMAFVINYITSWGYPWFVYPAFALLWWPLGVYFGQKKNPKAFSIVGGLLIAGFAYLVNMITSPSFPWFVFVAFGALWWPLGVILGAAKKTKLFSIIGSLAIAGFAYLVNMIVSPSFPWFIFVSFGALWWPLGVILGTAKKPKLFSIVASLYIIAFLFITNLVVSPNYMWFFYPAFAVLWWPISAIICGAKKYKLYAVVSTIYITAFLALVNYITSPQVPWFYHALYGLLWWPLSMMLAKKSPKAYAVVMSLITLGYLVLINYLHSPSELWWPYTAFHLIWWPLVMIIGKRAKTLWFAILGALSIIAYYVFLYYRLTPGAHLWYLYIILPAIWWPVCRAFGRKTLTIWFQLASVAIFMAYYVVLNLILTPEYFWAINLIYPLLWAAMGIYFGHTRKFFAFSVCAAIVTIVYFSILNYMVSPNVIWAVYPSFAILWWPLSLYFFRRKKPLKAAS